MEHSSHSAIYQGTLTHIRLTPVRHQFSYAVDSFLFDIDELDALHQTCRWFSLNRFNLFSLHYGDFGPIKTGEQATHPSPRRYVTQVLRDQGISQHPHRITLLCYPRILGYTFNPLAVYYCYNAQDQVFAILCEVSNTFGQRHSYLLDVSGNDNQQLFTHSCDKQFYVSPFIGMNAKYHFRLSRPGARIALAIRESEQGTGVLNAIFSGHRRPFTDRELLRSFLRLPFMTMKVMAGIHWEALKLWIKGMRILPRPTEPDSTISRIKRKTSAENSVL